MSSIIIQICCFLVITQINCEIISTNSTQIFTECSTASNTDKQNEFLCNEENNETNCFYNKVNPSSVIPLYGWKKRTAYDEFNTNDTSNFKVDKMLNIKNLKKNVSCRFSVCNLNIFTINEFKLCNESSFINDEDRIENCKNWTEFKLQTLKINESLNFTITSINTNETRNFSANARSNVYICMKSSLWKVYKLQHYKPEDSSQNSTIVKINNYSEILNLYLMVYLKKNSNLEISVIINKKKKKKNLKGKNCPGKWQHVNFQFNSSEFTILNFTRSVDKPNGKGNWGISNIKLYSINLVSTITNATVSTTPYESKTTISPAITATPATIINPAVTTTPATTINAKQPKESVTVSTITNATVSTTPYESTTTINPAITATPAIIINPAVTTTPATTINATQPKEEITTINHKLNTTITMTSTDVTTKDSRFNSTDTEPIKRTNILVALMILLVIFFLTLTFLGYLCYAYAFEKYPFDIKNLQRLTLDESLPKESNHDFSENYKKNKIKTVRSKADIPANTEELEVLVNSTNQEKTSTSIEIKKFEEYLMNYLEEDPYSNELTKQYRKIQTKMFKSHKIGLLHQNVSKNRYKSLVAYDDTRVVLRNNDNDDYINANYIDGYETTKAFIATQAPLNNTIGDFWSMVWQEEVTYIIMLTELIENGVKKSEQYWPELNQKSRFGNILIENKSVKIFADYTSRQFEINYNNITRLIHHYQYTTWPDHGVPTYPQNFTPFVKKILAMPQVKPIVVHCNAGCGRTGTLILCDIVLRMAAKEKIVDFVTTLIRIREQRKNLVNNVDQYIFAHFVVLECLFGADFSIPINDNFQNEIFNVLRKTTVKPLMVQLDKVMLQFKKRQGIFRPNICDDDKKKNRFSNILPGYTQIHLSPSSKNPSNYINAVGVDCYRCPKKFIVTQQPLPNTLSDFWTMITEFEINTIVSLNEIDENDENCPQFWQWQNQSTKLEILEEIKDRVYDMTKIKMVNESKDIEKTINVLKMKNWKRETSYPSNPKDLILLWKEMFNTSWKGHSIIIVTCYDGATASGLFVALAYLLEKINYEQICDVYSAIRTVKQSREQFVQEWGQIEFLYKAAKVYIEEFDNYDNFNN